MKINMNVNSIINIYNKNSKTDIVKKNKQNTNDSVEISKEGREISKYVELVKNTEIKTEKVDEIKKLISENRYKVDTQKLVKSILEHMKESDI